ncbi:54S ribosomal protein-like protein [Hapsidospora chrysogenum ATCC 11550]|uniref:54S ribosomal protein-like protein n=1 Tax=Hapsidospora chrysogenum (strain ATCC 11550 / CBS 779.69 / DSM 880 / IAM 14645 / JCM 23072 / IMI 49137) TaxID=857340 RepID=A0A086THY6_HAPC1|nr:54S ribosomal protein-like protein [Hapsidospora chrysogenum ATCC 11550]
MAMSCRYAAQSCARQLRASSSSSSARVSAHMLRASATSRRFNSTEAAASNPKIDTIVDQISQLTLLETADLVSTLKRSSCLQNKLNIPDLPVGGFAAAPAAAPAAEEAEEAEAPAQVKNLFTLKLQGIDPTAKAKVIKEVKAMLGLSLVDSKKFVESAPKMMKENVPKEDAEKIIATMKDLGATVVME